MCLNIISGKVIRSEITMGPLWKRVNACTYADPPQTAAKEVAGNHRRVNYVEKPYHLTTTFLRRYSTYIEDVS
jgi:hypothetical protein